MKIYYKFKKNKKKKPLKTLLFVSLFWNFFYHMEKKIEVSLFQKKKRILFKKKKENDCTYWNMYFCTGLFVLFFVFIFFSLYPVLVQWRSNIYLLIKKKIPLWFEVIHCQAYILTCLKCKAFEGIPPLCEAWVPFLCVCGVDYQLYAMLLVA